MPLNHYEATAHARRHHTGKKGGLSCASLCLSFHSDQSVSSTHERGMFSLVVVQSVCPDESRRRSYGPRECVPGRASGCTPRAGALSKPAWGRCLSADPNHHRKRPNTSDTSQWGPHTAATMGEGRQDMATKTHVQLS